MNFKNYIPFWTIPLIVGFALVTVWLRLAIVRTTYSINQFNKKIAETRQEQDLFHVKVAELRSPKRLENLARNKFKLNPPRTEQIIHLRTQEEKIAYGR